MGKWLVFCLLVIDIDLSVLSILHVERYSTCASISIFRIAEKAWRQAITDDLLTRFDPSVAWRLFFLDLIYLTNITKGLTFFPEGSKDDFVVFRGWGGGPSEAYFGGFYNVSLINLNFQTPSPPLTPSYSVHPNNLLLTYVTNKSKLYNKRSVASNHSYGYCLKLGALLLIL